MSRVKYHMMRVCGTLSSTPLGGKKVNAGGNASKKGYVTALASRLLIVYLTLQFLLVRTSPPGIAIKPFNQCQKKPLFNTHFWGVLRGHFLLCDTGVFEQHYCRR